MTVSPQTRCQDGFQPAGERYIDQDGVECIGVSGTLTR